MKWVDYFRAFLESVKESNGTRFDERVGVDGEVGGAGGGARIGRTGRRWRRFHAQATGDVVQVDEALTERQAISGQTSAAAHSLQVLHDGIRNDGVSSLAELNLSNRKEWLLHLCLQSLVLQSCIIWDPCSWIPYKQAKKSSPPST